MKLGDIIELFRSEVDDIVEPYLWSHEDAIEYANDAENEAARRARLIIDSSTAAICTIAVIAGTHTYALAPSVVFIRRARLTASVPLSRKTTADMDEYSPMWEESSRSTPRVYVSDADTGSIRLWPTPAANGTLNLTVVRTPVAEMKEDEDTPELNARFHRSLRFWMMFRAYSKQDADTNNPKKAGDALALFEQEFGRKSSAIDEAWISREQIDGDGTF